MQNKTKIFLKKLPFYKYLILFYTLLVKNKIISRYSNSSDELIFIHVGKCGGRSLLDAINRSPVVDKRFNSVKRVHVSKPPILKKSQYIIVVRNPISRALSAFNWRYKLVVEDETQKYSFKGEYEILVKYNTFNELAESLYEGESLNRTVANDFRTIHHLKQDLNYYLQDLLKKTSPKQVFQVLATEFLDDDIEKYLSIKNAQKIHQHRSSVSEERLRLSALAKKNLRIFLAKDYAVLRKLIEWKSIPADKSQVLLD